MKSAINKSVHRLGCRTSVRYASLICCVIQWIVGKKYLISTIEKRQSGDIREGYHDPESCKMPVENQLVLKEHSLFSK